jgi:biopolymer transport protein TolR
MGDINVTPFVDVMLVLLVVFMISAPLMTQGVQVSLPQVENNQINEKMEPIQVTIKRSGDVYVQERKIERKDMVETLKAIQARKPGTQILVRADKDSAYGQVMEVMSALQIAGLVDVGLITEPQSK